MSHSHVTITRVEGDAELTISWPVFASKDVVDDAMKRAIALVDPVHLEEAPKVGPLDRLIDCIPGCGSQRFKSDEYKEERIRDEIEDRVKQTEQLDEIENTVERYITREDATPLQDRVDELGQRMQRHETARKAAEDDGIALYKLLDAIEERARVGDVAAVLDLIHAHKNPPKSAADDDDVPF